MFSKRICCNIQQKMFSGHIPISIPIPDNSRVFQLRSKKDKQQTVSWREGESNSPHWVIPPNKPPTYIQSLSKLTSLPGYYPFHGCLFFLIPGKRAINSCPLPPTTTLDTNQSQWKCYAIFCLASTWISEHSRTSVADGSSMHSSALLNRRATTFLLHCC
jgi:hypothetical protein